MSQTQNSPVVRFAPSPTGFLHVGGARTALFNYLFARRLGGKFLLRIEDTDRERSTQESVDAILEGLMWLGVDWDGDPIFQSERIARHHEMIQILLKEGKAYKCFMTKEQLEERKKAQKAQGKPPRYDGRLEQLVNQNRNEPYVIRFLVPEGETTIRDAVKGDVTINHAQIEDFVLARSDGTPVYNFVVAIDDMDMGMTHVIRGDDHLSNTPKQVLVFEALENPFQFMRMCPSFWAMIAKDYQKDMVRLL